MERQSSSAAGSNRIRLEDRERWEKTIQAISQEVTDEEFTSWFSGLRLADLNSNHAYLLVSTSYRKEWMARQYTDFLEGVMGKAWGRKIAVRFLTVDEYYHRIERDSRPTGSRKTSTASLENSTLNPMYTFTNFVVGENNRMTHAAALAVAESPALFYNPLFIHGGVGLGKTHILQAIGHKIQDLHPGLRIFYSAAETFMNEFVDAIKRGDRVEFNDKYRNIDVLLIDDVHFLAGREGTQDEFFHTFNSLHNDHKQIVISSDRPPKDIPTLSDRLRSRFGWGLISDIQPPDFETRLAILRRKCELSNIPLDNEILLYIADKVRMNVRELEGALLRLAAHTRSSHKPLTLKITTQLLADLIPEEFRQLSIDTIQRRVAEYFHVKPSDLLGKNRSRSIALPRHIAMYLCKTLTDHSLTEIGTYFGNKDHTTVLYSCRKIQNNISSDNDFRRTVDRIKTFVKKVVNR